LIGAYLKAKYGEKNERRSQLRALADFLEGIAGTLERMEKSLRNDVVPTADGHRLEEIVGEFASLIQRAPLDSKWKKKAEATRAQLQLHLRSGEILDDIIRGYVLEGPPDTKANLLHGMVETSLPRTGPGNVSVHAAVVIPIQTSDSEKPP
jgi:hypothetical protein